MRQHRMIRRETEFAHHFHAMRFGLHAIKLNALLRFIALYAIQAIEEVEVPPAATKLAISDHFQAIFPLFRHHIANRLIFNLAQGSRINLSGCKLFARLLNGGGTQKAANGIGTERGGFSLHDHSCLSCH